MSELLQVFELNSYVFNPYALAPLFVFALTFLMGAFLFSSDRSTHEHKAIAYVLLVISLWSGSLGFLFCANNQIAIIFLSKCLLGAMCLFPVAVYHHCIVVVNKFETQQFLLKCVYLMAVGIIIYIFAMPVIIGFGAHPFGFYPLAGASLLIVVAHFAAWYFSSIVNLIFSHFVEEDAAKKRQIRWFVVAITVAQLSLIDFLAVYDHRIFPAGFIVLFGYAVCLLMYQLRNQQEQLISNKKVYTAKIEEKSREVSDIMIELRATQLKLMESGKVSALASLSAGILHQISQPITAIHGFVKFIKKEMDSKETFYKPICLIEEQSIYIKEMLEDLMHLIRHRAIKKFDINVNDAMHRSLNLLADELRIKRIQWNLELDKALPSVYADAIHVQQIFMNIIINAIKALSVVPKSDDRLLIISTRHDQKCNEVVITIEDTGPGISEEDRLRIFDPFYSSDESGTGMGLALCKDLISEHGGTIAVESQPDEGAKFVIRLPVSKNKDK